MSSSRRRERERVHEVLQDAADRLTADVPDRVQIGVSDEEIMFDCITWSSALTRHHFAGETARRMLAPSEWMTCAEDESRFLFGEAIDAMRDRWDSAAALGLVQGDVLADLAPGGMVIDRTLLGMLDALGIDIRWAAARIAASAPGTSANDASGVIGVRMDHGSVFALHEGVGRPVLRTALPVGAARYDGRSLSLDCSLPDVIAGGAVGRPLGAIVDTGIPDLDRRLVAGVETFDPARCGRIGDPTTALELAPDLVRLSSRDGRTSRAGSMSVRASAYR